MVTGAASGIGLCAARQLARGGHLVVLLDRSTMVHQAAESLADEGANVLAVVADLSNLQEIHAACEQVDRALGGCDVLVNNAGIHLKRSGRFIPDEELTADDWESTLRVNVVAPFLLSQWAVRGMQKRAWGRIVNVASRAGRTCGPAAGTHYASSKAALIGMTRNMAAHYGSSGITINAVAPGHVLTPMAQQHSPEVLARSASGNPLGRLGRPEEIASAILYLTTENAGFITGAVIDVNGGSFMG